MPLLQTKAYRLDREEGDSKLLYLTFPASFDQLVLEEACRPMNLEATRPPGTKLKFLAHYLNE